VDYCNNNKIAMVFTGVRHFKHWYEFIVLLFNFYS
jgi:hypothetical protein